MRIVQINAVNGVGSTGNIVLDIHNRLIGKGHESFVLWGTKCKNPEDSCFIRIGNNLDHKIHAFMRRLDLGQGFHSKLATRQACKEIKKIKPEIVHLHNLHSNYIDISVLLKFLKNNNIPVVINLHDCWFFTGYCTYYQKHDCLKWQSGCKGCPAVSSRKRKKVEKMYSKKQRLFEDIENLHVIGVSEWTANDARRSFLKNSKNITYIYNWLNADLNVTRASRDSVCEKYGLDKRKKIILGVAQGWNPNNKKGAREFCELANHLNETAEVVLVGQNNGMPEIKGLNCIGYTSSQKELMDLYAAADVFVNPSRFETFGLVTIEALSQGTPVIAYRNTSATELVGEDYGILVEDGNIEKMIDTVESVLSTLPEKKTSVFQEYVRNNFGKETQIDKYIDFYNSILLEKTIKSEDF